MKTLSKHIYESILASSHAGKAGIDALYEKYGLNPDWVTVHSDMINGLLNCSYNKLSSLKGAPNKIKWNFDCSYNELTSLEDGPEQVGGDFDCSHNKLISLVGLPKKLNGYLSCYCNSVFFTKKDILALCKINAGKIYC